MASITTQRGGNRYIQFVDENSARKTIRLGKCDRKSAESFCRHVETLLAAATVAKRLSFARTFLHVARKHNSLRHTAHALSGEGGMLPSLLLSDLQVYPNQPLAANL
jgi:hypothetical protein